LPPASAGGYNFNIAKALAKWSFCVFRLKPIIFI